MARYTRSTIRSLHSAGKSVADFTNTAASGLFRWASTDHTGISKRLTHMPESGFLDSVKYLLLQFLISILATAVTGVLVFVLIAYGIPLLFFGGL